MNRLRTFKPRLRAVACVAAAAVICAASIGSAAAAETNTPAAKMAAPKTADTKAKSDKKPAKKLTGAELYAINCNRCHPERYATEFTASQWKTIMMHMRVRANLPAEQAKVILKYLQEDSGS